MDAVVELGAREVGALGDDVAKTAVARDLPVDREIRQRHPAVTLHRFGGEARPDDEAVARRIARRDAEAERKLAEDTALGAQDRGGGKAGEGGPGKEMAAVEHGWAPRGRITAPGSAAICFIHLGWRRAYEPPTPHPTTQSQS